jgi:hypothetical protein
LDWDILWLGVPPKSCSTFSFQLLGYDLGYYDQGHFSSIYHEVIPARYDELGPFGAALNSNLLLPSRDLANQLRETRMKLIGVGIDLEQAGTCRVVPVYSLAPSR